MKWLRHSHRSTLHHIGQPHNQQLAPYFIHIQIQNLKDF
jgi:hypothetical protein